MSFDEPITYSIVIPCYRSGRWLPELVRRVAEVMGGRGESFEVVLVNDASLDDTWESIEALAQRYEFVHGVDLLYNTGQYRATLCGLEHARGEYVITMDDDLQHPPEELPRLIEALRADDELDCVMARFAVKRHGPLRNMGSRLAGWLNARLYGQPRVVVASSFRILRRELAEAICRHGTVNPILGPLLFQTTRRIANVDVRHEPRRDGRSGYSLWRLAVIVLDNLFSATTLPLRLVSLLGLASAAGSALFGAYNLLKYFLGYITVGGFATQVLLILFFGGLTLFSIGLLGEYVIRIMQEVRRAPRYCVRQRCGSAVTTTSQLP